MKIYRIFAEIAVSEDATEDDIVSDFQVSLMTANILASEVLNLFPKESYPLLSDDQFGGPQ